jgi:hypothetical protein
VTGEAAALQLPLVAEAEVGVEPQLPLVAATVMAAVKEAAVREAAVSWVVAAVALLPLPLVGAEVGVASVAMVVAVTVVVKREAPSSVVAVKEAAPQLLRLRADPAAAVTVAVKGEAASSGALLRLLQHSLRVAAAAMVAAAVKEAAVAL